MVCLHLSAADLKSKETSHIFETEMQKSHSYLVSRNEPRFQNEAFCKVKTD
jgi:hypothetical protein